MGFVDAFDRARAEGGRLCFSVGEDSHECKLQLEIGELTKNIS